MRLPWQRREDGGAAVAEPTPPTAPELPALDELNAQIDELTEANRAQSDPDRERAILRARHLAAIRLMDDAPADPRFPDVDGVVVPEGNPLPEFTLGELTPEMLRAALLRDGCALVRDLIPQEMALELADGIDAAHAQREAKAAGTSAGGGYYEEFEPHERFGPVMWRAWEEQLGSLLCADSPTLAFRYIEALRARGVDRLIAGYLGEPALFSVHKTTLRKASPATAGAWHQDGKFMGPVRALNVWLSLSRCGDLAPGLDIVPRRLGDYVATGTEGAALDWTISEDQAQAAAGTSTIVRPIFEPGDALLFDEVFLHKTGSDPEMPNPRYAVESWFFGGSAFPADYAPIAI